MKTKTLVILIAGSISLIACEFLKTTIHADSIDSIQGFGVGLLIGGALTAFVEWREKRTSNNTLTTQEAK